MQLATWVDTTKRVLVARFVDMPGGEKHFQPPSAALPTGRARRVAPRLHTHGSTVKRAPCPRDHSRAFVIAKRSSLATRPRPTAAPSTTFPPLRSRFSAPPPPIIPTAAPPFTMKFDVNILRYIEKDAWRVLVSVEMGMKNHELVPVELINSISGLKHGGAYKYIRELLKHKLVHHENQKYDGYRLTPLGYDFLAIKAFVNRGAIVGVGRRIGVGKESDVFEVVTEEGETLALKLHRLGRTSFRAVKSKRDYIKSTTTHTNWLYLSRLAALKEHAFMKALGDNGFPVPTAVDVNRHAVLMSLIDGTPLTQRYKCSDPGRVYAQCVEQLANLARCGLVHCDFNEFNIMCNDDLDITIIDFPQMVSSNHPNAEELFVRDLKCLHKFFLRRFNYRADEDPNGVQDPKFFDVAAGGVGHGAGEGVEKSLDVSLRASGFTAAAGRDLEEYNAARVAQRDAEEGVDQDARRDENDDEDENHRHASASDSSDDDFEGQRGGDERSRFG